MNYKELNLDLWLNSQISVWILIQVGLNFMKNVEIRLKIRTTWKKANITNARSRLVNLKRRKLSSHLNASYVQPTTLKFRLQIIIKNVIIVEKICVFTADFPQLVHMNKFVTIFPICRRKQRKDSIKLSE